MNTEARMAILARIKDYPDEVIAMAYMFAKTLMETGVPMATLYDSATKMHNDLHMAYCRGRFDEAQRWVDDDKT